MPASPHSNPFRSSLLICDGLTYDGSGQKPYRGDVTIRADRVVAVGKLTNARALTCSATTAR